MEESNYDFYTLIITFSEIDVVVDSNMLGNYLLPSPVYLKVASKRMLLIKQDVLFWYPDNNTQNDRRWVEFKILDCTKIVNNGGKETET